ncbi:hypothetical protein Lupro_02785 [Lutibacter profundi]|uniref:Uncharacterized protein n=1 Tax=Lutibacter profundi TaxID=1622118 RepID=A0A120IE13_9FLAO|nr:hypothetical protein [Lutibacter profundi]AMC10242.1 hypothetical protein Lupro_02785 [Lutibacter profundi]
MLVKEITGSQITNNISAKEAPIGQVLIPIFVEHYTDWYQNLNGGNTYFYLVSTKYSGTTVEYVYVNTGFQLYGTYHEHFDDPHGPPNHPDNHPDEIILDPSSITVVETLKPILDLNDFLKCINKNIGATITIYVDQPFANSDVIASPLDKAGHSFISINQNGNVSTFGFYPNGHATPYSPTQSSAIGDDSGHSYDVSISFNVAPSVLQNIMEYSYNYNPIYDLNSYNCTDFAIEIGNMAGLSLPDCYQPWINDGGGSNPATFGQYIRNNLNNNSIVKNITGGTSPINIKNCL